MMYLKTLKFNLFFLLLALFVSNSGHAEGKILENREINSSLLGKRVKYSVYLPEDYEISQKNYPVVYLLHGMGQNSSSWVQEGEIKRNADRAIENGTIPPMILIMPDAERTWYINSSDGKVLYEDFFIKELIPEVEKTFRIRPERKYRGIAGLSMGGYGTFYYALKYPEMFSAAAPLSAAIRSDSTILKMTNEEYDGRFGKVFGLGLTGTNRLTPFYYAHSLLYTIKMKPASELAKVRYWIDCGDDDGLSEGNCLAHILLAGKKVPHEFRIRDGAHNWTCAAKGD